MSAVEGIKLRLFLAEHEALKNEAKMLKTELDELDANKDKNNFDKLYAYKQIIDKAKELEFKSFEKRVRAQRKLGQLIAHWKDIPNLFN